MHTAPISPTFRGRRWKVIKIYVIAPAIIAPMLFLSIYGYKKISEATTAAALERQAAVAARAAAELGGHMADLADIVLLLAGHDSVRRPAAGGDWSAVMAALSDHRPVLSDDQRFIIVDAGGHEQAAVPDPSSPGADITAPVDWFRSVIERRSVSISGLYRKSAVSGGAAFFVAAPVTDAAGGVVGVLALEIGDATIRRWAKGIDVGAGTTLMVVDSNGLLAAHPAVPPDGSFIDLTSDPIVRKATWERGGAEIAFDPIEKGERLRAYAQVPGHDWGVIVSKDVASGLASSYVAIWSAAMVFALAIVVAWALAYLILHYFSMIETEREIEEMFLQSIGEGIVAVDARGRVRFMNARAEELIGLKSADVVGKSWFICTTVEDEKGRVVSREEQPLHYSLSTLKTAGSGRCFIGTGTMRFPVTVSTMPLILRGSVVGALMDIREVKRSVEEGVE